MYDVQFAKAVRSSVASDSAKFHTFTATDARFTSLPVSSSKMWTMELYVPAGVSGEVVSRITKPWVLPAATSRAPVYGGSASGIMEPLMLW